MGAGRVIVIDHLDYRLEKARSFAHAETYNFTEYDDIVVHMKKITDYLGSDVAIDAAGAEADGNLMQHISSAKLKLQGGSPIALNWAIDLSARAALSVMGAYGPMFSGQVRRRHEQGPHLTNEPMSGETAMAAAVRAHSQWIPEAQRDRHSPVSAGPHQRGVPHLLGEAG